MQERDLHGHPNWYLVRFGCIDTFYACINLYSLFQVNHAGAIWVFSIIALLNHKGRCDRYTCKRMEPALPLHLNPLHL